MPFKIVTDPALGITDVVMETPAGGLEAKLSDTLTNIDHLLAQAGADTAVSTPPLPTESHLTPEEDPQASPLDTVARETTTRAQQLLGDDELVDALK